ncbi:MAG: OmpA family protein [Rhodospirillaceae bacterium]
MLAATIPALMLAGCGYTTVDALNKTPTPPSQNFSGYLADDYKSFANYEGYQMYDWPDAQHFANKGLAAAKGQAVPPEDPGKWKIRNAHMRADLDAAHARLHQAIAKGGGAKAPQAMARAQVEYDCWVEQAEEGWQYNDIASCRNGFVQAMMVVDRGLAGPVAAQPPMPAAPTPARDYLVFFNFDSAELTDNGRDIIRSAAEAARQQNIRIFQIVGHADRSGSDRYNQALSMRRAETVARELQQMGFDRRDLMISAKGESDPLVQTADGVREPQNRRVTISINPSGAGA